MPRVLIADKIAEEGLELLRRAPNVTFDVRHGLPAAELAAAIGDYDGVLIRSAVQITRDTLSRPGQLMAIARAGVGVDNVDVDAATAAGVLVLNTPDANTISTAEHTFAMMLALYRRIPDAHQHVVSGQWNRSAYEGRQLAGQTLGVIGLGRIGRAVAQRALAFGMKVVAYDPFVTTASALDGAVTLYTDLNEFLAECDCITLHASLTEKTRHMIGRPELAQMRTGARLVNCARGLLVDEQALAEALNGGHLAGAAIDVYEHEPPKDSPLLTARNVVLAPHLAASTAEAQRQVSLDAVEALLAYLLRGEIRSAVNVTGMPASLSPRVRSFVDLSARLGTILSPWCAAGVERVSVWAHSEALRDVTGTLAAQVLTTLLLPHLSERINLVNAHEQARRRGIVLEHAVHSLAPNHPETVHALVTARGQRHGIEGTVFADGRMRVLAIDGYRMELAPAGPMALIFNDDRPGVIGLVGQKLGDAGVNVADMALSRQGKTALMVLKLDEPMPDPVYETLKGMNPPILSVHRVVLPLIPNGPS
ncbi:MAG: phosphoglycerate dehydrogenase [Planctomycetes bacterium]|nr:phosphoglycerate dehydrogenase [Planctomycetota bacterium]